MELIIAVIGGLLLGGIGVFIFKKIQDDAQKKSASLEAERILNRAKAESAKIDKDSKARAKDFEARARKNAEVEIQKQRSQLKNKETQLERRLRELDEIQKSKAQESDRELQKIKNTQEKLQITENRIKENEHKLQDHLGELKTKLERVAQMTTDEAKRTLTDALEADVRKESAVKIEKIEKEAEKEAETKSKKILATAIARFASEYTSEKTVSVMALDSEEMKGKIIGREGRNIRTLEALCGVDLIVDDTPEAVVISGFDAVRREMARRTIAKLMEDGRVHPARIEEVVDKVRIDLAKSIQEEGEKACLELGLPNVHIELIKTLGSLKYRQSHTQNLLFHSLEVAYLAGNMASEMGLNVKIARRAGLFHDIGKAIEHTVEGSHAFVGAEYCKKYGESEEVCHAIRAHHNEELPHSLLAHIVQAANILSNSRPGARRPGMDNFIHRLQELESIANSFDGVLRSYALQAGKEVRVFVESSRVTDGQSSLISHDIVRKIEREMPHLGQVRVVVVRETRSVDIAR